MIILHSPQLLKTYNMKTTWFKHLGPFYVPIHFMGYIITMFCILFLVPVWIDVIRYGHSISDDLYHILFTQAVLLSGGSGLQKKHLTKTNNNQNGKRY